MWSRHIGALAGVSVPLQPVKHQYVITEKLEGLATQPFLEALWMAKLDGLSGDPAANRWGLYLAIPDDQRNGIEPEDLAEFLEDVREGSLFQLELPKITTFPGEHAEGLLALDAAMKDLNAGRVELAVVGGADSLLHSEHLHDLLAAGRLKTDLTTAGLIPGEAAAFLVPAFFQPFFPRFSCPGSPASSPNSAAAVAILRRFQSESGALA